MIPDYTVSQWLGMIADIIQSLRLDDPMFILLGMFLAITGFGMLISVIRK